MDGTNSSCIILDDIEDMVIPPDFQAALDDKPESAANFHAFGDSNKKMLLHWISTAKTAGTRARRISEIISHAARNELPHH